MDDSAMVSYIWEKIYEIFSSTLYNILVSLSSLLKNIYISYEHDP